MAKRWGWILGVILSGASWVHAQPPAGGAPKAGEGGETIPAPRRTTTETAPATTTSAAPVSFTEPAPRDQHLIFGGVDYLLWDLRRNNAPPLLTTGAGGATPTVGLPGDAATQVLYAPAGVDFPSVNGLRIRAGVFLDSERYFSVQGEGILFNTAHNDLQAASAAPGKPFLARPYLDVFNNKEAFYRVSSANGFTGRNDFRASSHLYGWDTNFGYHLSRTMAVYVGFRSLSLHDRMRLEENVFSLQQGTANGSLVFLNNPIGAAQSLQIVDEFTTSNRFYGPQLGGQYRWEFGPLSFDLMGKLAVGANFQRAGILGATNVLNADGSTAAAAPGGVLALPSNMGFYSKTEFTLAPELDFNVCWDFASFCRLRLGYSILYMSSVLRAGNQIERFVDPRQVPSDSQFNAAAATTRPSFVFSDKDFWAHGVNFGVEFRY